MPKSTQKNGSLSWIKDSFTLPPPKPKGWHTINEIVKITGNKKCTVKSRVEKMVAAGELQVMKVMSKGKSCHAYKKK